MNLSGDFRLVFAVVAASAGVAGALVVKGIWMKLAVLAVGLVIAAYLAGLIPDYFGIFPR